MIAIIPFDDAFAFTTHLTRTWQILSFRAGFGAVFSASPLAAISIQRTVWTMIGSVMSDRRLMWRSTKKAKLIFAIVTSHVIAFDWNRP
jgi:hypothetical protein